MVTLEEIEDYIKTKYGYKTIIDNNRLTIKKKKHTLIITIYNTEKGSCYTDSKWIGINNCYNNQEHGYGVNITEYTTEIIDKELKYFEED